MKKQRPRIDLSNDLVLVRYGNGLILIKPEQLKAYQHNLPTISALLTFPFNVFLTSNDSYFYQLNHSTTESLGFTSVQDSIGRSSRESADQETIKLLLFQDKMVVENKKIIEEISFKRKLDNDQKRYLVIKLPLYDYKQNKIAGIFGVGISLHSTESYTLADALAMLTQTSLLAPEPPWVKNFLTPLLIDDVTFTCREKDVLRHMKLGKSAKEIGFILNLSPRTVEDYIKNIKIKLNVNSKSAIIEKILPFLDEDSK